MKKHEQFEKYRDDLKAEGISFFNDGGAPFFVGYLESQIQHAEEDRKGTLKIDDILKAMKKACEFASEQNKKQ